MARTSTTERTWSEKALLALVRARFAPPAYAVFEQVRSSTGFGPVRTIDAVVASLWPSNGLHLHAVECKTSREDLRRELEDPAKSEAFTPFASKFWLCAPRSVVLLSELPAHWGWLAPHDTGSGVVLRAEREADTRQAEPLSGARLMALLRAAQRDAEAWVPRAELRQLVEAELDGRRAAAEEVGRQRGEARAVAAERDLAQLRARVEAFERASGLSLDLARNYPADFGQLLKTALQGRLGSYVERAGHLATELAQIAAGIERGVGSWRALDEAGKKDP